MEIEKKKLSIVELSGTKKIIYDEVKKIYEQEKKVSPSIVLELAKDPNHPLHNFFEWDNETASNKYRLIQARELINSIIIEVINEQKNQKHKVRAFFSVSKNSDSEMVMNGNQHTDNYFVSIEDVESNDDLMRYEKLKAKSELKAFQMKYSFLDNYLGSIFNEIEKL